MASKGIVIQITGDGESAKRALELVQENLRHTGETAKHEASEISEAMEKVAHALESIGIYLGIREVIDGLKELVAGSVETGVELGHLAKQTGISTENLSVMKYMAEQTGVGFEVLTKGFKKLSTEILGAEEGKKESIATFARLNITQAQVSASGNDLFAVLELIADRFQTLPDGPLKAAEAQALFGKAGMALIPILNEGSSGVAQYRSEAESLGLVLNESTIGKMEELHASMVKAKGSAEGAGLAITSALLPAILDLDNGLVFLIEKMKEFLGLQQQIAGQDPAKQHAAYKAIPDSILALSADQRTKTSVSAGANAKAAEEELDKLKELHDKHLISDKAFAEASLKQQMQANAARLTEAQADVANQEALRDEAASHLHDVQEGRSGARKLFDGIGLEDQDLDDALSQLNYRKANADEAYGRLIKAQEEKKGEGGITLGDQSGKAKAGKGDNSLATAAASLADEQARAMGQAQKQTLEGMLAELEAQHKMMLLADKEFYDEKLRLQSAELAAEQAALEAKASTLQALEARQHGDKTLKRDGNGNSAEELKTARELVQVQEQLGALKAKGQALESAYNAENYTSAQASELEGLKLAADLERERNSGLSAQIALLERENALQVQKVRGAGGSDADAANIQALGALAEAKLRIADVDRQIRSSEADNKRAVDELNDAAAKDPRLKDAARKQINALNQQEADQLRGLVAQYDALAQVLGGEYIEAARNLHEELDKLSTPDRRDEAALSKTLVTGLESMTKQIVDMSAQGTESFHKMVKSIEKDALDLGLKLLEQKYLTPALEGGGSFGSSAPGRGGAGSSGGLAGLLGSAGPQLLGPGPSASGAAGAGGGALAALSAALGLGGGGKNNSSQTPLTIKIINESSQPVEASSATQGGLDGEFEDSVISVVLKNASQGGALLSLFSAG